MGSSPTGPTNAQVSVSLLYAATVVATLARETWIYYILGSIIEVAFLLAIARIAWARRAHTVE